MANTAYETIIGLEVHVQLATASKAFCADDASFGGEPNTQVSSISLGHPGTLPKANGRQIEFATRLGLALGCHINATNTFDRKNYFYADLPKGYQITQDKQPICVGGELPIKLGNSWKTIRIHHIHMEEDAGKSIHTMSPRHSFIDLNRAGVPLVEIVTEPDLRSGEEVDAFMTAMRQLVRYLEVSDGNMEQGSLRCDVNISIREQGATMLNDRCEVKNVNSMKFARQAIDYEVQRQIGLVESGGKIKQQTLNFDPNTGVTSPLREKEDAHDYRYFPEPDLPPIVLSHAYIEAVKNGLPALPQAMYTHLTTEYQLSDYDASILMEEKNTGVFYLSLVQHTKNYKSAANLVINRILPWCQEQRQSLSNFPLDAQQLAALIQLIEEGKISNTAAYQNLFPAMLANPQQAPMALAESLNLLQNSDGDFLQKIAEEILAQFPDKVKEYQKGKKGLIGFFMGELMKRSKGKADPKVATGILEGILTGTEKK
ncbi:Asp-tRNA(Asn)/Glu-tRNA(Gln) amidotransferase subunit GatB [Haliscomenobacter hydrossis]|uniref:Aspartyl/glutamyl-tRNA(Asn/Gln) amidotransferase subunit B n=1 Tax=Haliscomenobacter hydrossis (strain ATCC 27775 / DSM 1100 / LMG 10767 / O) TaxID=760192 RepID=F4KWQ7_HALH1|nr:Asp-tRNA(Asn)/Glu-tRNA(Gln) amidotransferase subunit GatB [Haliscomenobacter hydrossis]AEE52540.1 Aspartyl/glutamyl-tRNA(Asn/Gln) amidotransferase subunit B [Haliscomenobacter hydrossis DSM 1100]